jgi:hypothetical protein
LYVGKRLVLKGFAGLTMRGRENDEALGIQF